MTCIQSNRMLRSPIQFVFLVLLATMPAAVLAASGSVVPLASDAYHYQFWANGQHDGTYTEWWYFNFFDSRQNLQAIFTYLITDPQDLTGRGLAQLTAVAYTPNGIVSENDSYPTTSFSAAYDRANVQIEGNSVQVVGGMYEIKGASKDGRLSWDLWYTPQAAPWYAASRMNVGVLPWEQMSWLLYMPRAQITGELTVDQHVYSVQAVPGYHDHNWGEWIPTDALWNWAQYSQPGLAIDLGDFIGKPAGLASIDFAGQRTVFTKGQYRLVHTRWALDPVNLVWYPTETVLQASNGSLAFTVTMHVAKTDPLRANLPFPLRDVIVYEQTAHYEGQVWERDSTGQWAAALSFQGDGFKEYTAKHY